MWDDLQEQWVADLFNRVYTEPAQIVATAPTGFGKTRCMGMLIKKLRDMNVVLYTHRKLLFEQTFAALEKAGIEAGKRAAGHATELWKSVQIAMLPTEAARVLKQGQRELHDAQVVIWDEGHIFKSGVAAEVAAQHKANGAANIWLTATPVGMGHLADYISVGATNSQCRQVGAHVLCETFGPNEVDLPASWRRSDGEYSPKKMGDVYRTQHVVASVLKNYFKLNPHQKPAILFGPGVPESKWYCDKFNQSGVPAAHIDGKHCRLGGKDYDTTQELRDEIAAMSKSGEIKVVTNRFVLREGVDWPWLYHAIFATTFGTEEGFLQAGGRLLRNHDGLDKVVLQCHGGSWHRYGSLNENRVWSLEDTNKSRETIRRERREKGEEKEPQRCPQCGGIRKNMGGPCPYCGHSYQRSVRRVVELDGELNFLGERSVTGNVTKKKRKTADWQKKWDSMFYAARNSKSPRGQNFNQLRSRFERETGLPVKQQGGKMVVYVDGQPQHLRNIPPPDSMHWHSGVRDVDGKKLQN